MNRWLAAGLVGLAACASAHARDAEPQVKIRVVNGARYTMSVRACPPGPCSDLRELRPGARTTFTFSWRGYSRHVVEGRDGSRVAIQVPVDFHGPGHQTVTLLPRHHPQESIR